MIEEEFPLIPSQEVSYDLNFELELALFNQNIFNVVFNRISYRKFLKSKRRAEKNQLQSLRRNLLLQELTQSKKSKLSRNKWKNHYQLKKVKHLLKRVTRKCHLWLKIQILKLNQRCNRHQANKILSQMRVKMPRDPQLERLSLSLTPMRI